VKSQLLAGQVQAGHDRHWEARPPKKFIIQKPVAPCLQKSTFNLKRRTVRHLSLRDRTPCKQHRRVYLTSAVNFAALHHAAQNEDFLETKAEVKGQGTRTAVGK
jgi:hypothetical protein